MTTRKIILKLFSAQALRILWVRSRRNARREIKAPKKALAGGIGLEWLISSPFKH